MASSLFVLFVASASFLQAHSPTPTPTPSPQATHSASPSPSPSVTPTPSASPSPLPSGSEVASPAPSVAGSSPELTELMSQAEAHFARRSVGAVDDIASPREVDEAIGLYRKAVALAPGNFEILTKLMRALHFRGAYTGASIEEKKVIFEEGRKLGQDAVDKLEASAKAAKGMSRIESLRLVKGAPGLYIWTAGHWGEWALVRGKMASVKSGIAGRLRDLSQTVIDLDPLFEDAAGYRLLGRLHAEAPRIPFITGWVSHDKGVALLRKSYQANPHHPVTLYFLAEAILDYQPEKRAEGLRLLEQCMALTPRPETPLEDARYMKMAAKRLEKEKSGS
ncbi:MAG: hypothetical protein ABI672_02930 [Vicinamibacteria bacterium]